MPLQQLAFFAILLAAFVLLLTERIRNDVVAILIVLALAASGVLSPREAVAGFSSEPALVVAGIFVLGAGLHRTGLSDRLGAWIGGRAGGGWTRAVAVLMSSVAILSAFTHHVTTTAVMLPITLTLAGYAQGRKIARKTSARPRKGRASRSARPRPSASLTALVTTAYATVLTAAPQNAGSAASRR